MDENPVICRICGAGVAIRISRTGFFQRHILSLLGIYPWKCGACGSAFLSTRRRSGTKAGSSSRAKGHRVEQAHSTQI